MKYASKKAFTMIELIFVIVIIGILAAVAIPKLAVTRDDAKVSEIIANARTAVGDLGTFYASQGSDTWNDDTNGTLTTATNVPFSNPGCDGLLDDNKSKLISSYALCSDDQECLLFTGDTNGLLTIDAGGDYTTGGTAVCDIVVEDKAIVNIITSHNFGGKTVVR